MLRFDDQRVLVLGLGESGLAVARWVAAGGGDVRIADTRAEPPMRAALASELPQAQFVGGDFAEALLDGVACVVISPGLSPTRSPAAPLLRIAKQRGLEVLGEIEVFARALAQLRSERDYRPRVIGITGTNGKTTTTRLAGLLVERCARRVAVAGNVSPSALDTLRQRLAAADLPDVWVLELSSFQLATTSSLACDAATVLNLTPDHLDWHGSLEDYARAKARVFGRDTVQVVNRDDPQVVALARKGAPVVTFGAGAPRQGGQYGLVRDAALTWLACVEHDPTAVRRRKAARKVAAAGAEPAAAVGVTAAAVDSAQAPSEGAEERGGEVFVQRLMPVDALRIRGRHNALNALAALALARAIGCPLAPMLHALREYRGEPHRVERIATVDGVEYYDDSKGTNVGATVAALEGLGAPLREAGKRLVVILGGEGKGQDFAPLRAPLRAYARAAALIGRDAAAIAAVLADLPLASATLPALPAAVDWCARHAEPGDAVLLSPACASLDMFRNYEHRGDVFGAAVREIAARRGVPC
jgi:UDP-N-acetylmuramoylalanine--D-glutamate ligase